MRTFLGAIGASLLLASMIVYAQTEQSVPTLDNESSDSWFVELASPPSAEGTAAATLEREEASFHAAAAGAGVRYARGRSYRDLWNGVTVRATAGEVSKLRALPGVQAVYPVVRISLQQAEDPPGAVADLVTATKMTGADIAQSELGLSGRGVKVAVIDTGIDYNHPDLGGCFGRGCRVEKGYDFVGDDFNADPSSPAYNPVPAPDNDPDDCNGHGTHVSGIVGANGGIKGVAPDVTFRAYRVFGCEGSTTSDIMLAAMERARADGADVVNMSIGSALQWPQYPTAKAADSLVKPRRRRRGVDRQRGRARPLRRRGARRRQERDRRRVVRQLAREPRRLHAVPRRGQGRLHRRHRRAGGAGHRLVPHGAHRHDHDHQRRVRGADAGQPDGQASR